MVSLHRTGLTGGDGGPLLPPREGSEPCCTPSIQTTHHTCVDGEHRRKKGIGWMDGFIWARATRPANTGTRRGEDSRASSLPRRGRGRGGRGCCEEKRASSMPDRLT